MASELVKPSEMATTVREVELVPVQELAGAAAWPTSTNG
jgi:hypothetical protein